ncbi:MAG: pyruvate, phosphate dikinase [Acidobacteria bacterium]|nr:MAG: pyruvate, phosphate dikinase [Acidobacteriota bacterium]
MEQTQTDQGLERIIKELTERAKEFNCLYEIQKLMNNPEVSFDHLCEGITRLIPPGMQFPEVCRVQIIYGNKIYQVEEFNETKWRISSCIKVQDRTVGKIDVYYLSECPQSDIGPFNADEQKLVDNIANQLGMHSLHQQLKSVFEPKKKISSEMKNSEWFTILDLIKKTDTALTARITRKMINHLCLRGIKNAIKLFAHYTTTENLFEDRNFPFQVMEASDTKLSTTSVFSMAHKHLSEDEILAYLKTWINEDNSGFVANVFQNTGSTFDDLREAIERYYHLAYKGSVLSPLREKSYRVSLIRRLFTDQTSLIDIAKKYISIRSFYELTHNIISPPESHGKLGGKSAGLFIAKKILQNSGKKYEFMNQIKTPKTWYITSDGMLSFIKHNNLEDTYEQKYKDIGIIGQEYPYLVHVFKNSPFPPEMISQLSNALDDFGCVPLVIRSSSLLEDRMGTAFAGKYKSLFIPNQGPKEKRLIALMDAISEIYASTFGPDPLEYRFERQLLDYHEEMGIMIQEVIGQRVGDYFFPAFAGVAFSTNEFRWSVRLRRKDGLIRIVPGLGTRAVDRVNDDYPTLIAPGQPNLRVNVTPDEVVRYSPKKIDLINLKTRKFETRLFEDLVKECGSDYPKINRIVSIVKDSLFKKPRAFGVDYANESAVVTFDGLISDTDFISKMNIVLNELEDAYGCPVDIEFAHNGESLYLLQCRPQSHGQESDPAVLPSGVLNDKVLFTADKYVQNGFIQGITHIVYVDPMAYGNLATKEDMQKVGHCVGKINQLLPKRQFILMGPGRWGSKGDIKLGVPVTYSEINQSAMLIEIARKKKNYVPDVSFGTHFFLDLVESNIRYLPLYPDDEGIIFNEEFLLQSRNIFGELLPEEKQLEKVIKVIDLTTTEEGPSLSVYMNSELKKAIAVFSDTPFESEPVDLEPESIKPSGVLSVKKTAMHWQWRMRSLQHIASMMDSEFFGVKKLYVIGSTKNGTARPDSDIDVLIHFEGSTEQKRKLLVWLDGWSQSLSYFNYMRTGVVTNGLLDIHIVTDEDIEKQTSYASKIGAVTDAAKQLVMGNNLSVHSPKDIFTHNKYQH